MRWGDTLCLKLEPSLFPLSNPRLTSVFGGGMRNWNLSSRAHIEWINRGVEGPSRGKRARQSGESSRSARTREKVEEEQPTQEETQQPHVSPIRESRRDRMSPPITQVYQRIGEMQNILCGIEGLNIRVESQNAIIHEYGIRSEGVEMMQQQQLEMQQQQMEMLRRQMRMQ